jgi:hypothetical protein
MAGHEPIRDYILPARRPLRWRWQRRSGRVFDPSRRTWRWRLTALSAVVTLAGIELFGAEEPTDAAAKDVMGTLTSNRACQDTGRDINWGRTDPGQCRVIRVNTYFSPVHGWHSSCYTRGPKENIMRLSPIAIAITLVMSSACGKKDDSKTDKSKPGAADKAPAKAAAPAKQTLAQVLEGVAKPALLGPFAKGKFGMTKAELATASPVFADKGDFLSNKDFGVGYYAGLEGEPEKRFTSLRVTITAAEAGELDKAWGAGTKLTYRRKASTAWLNPEAKVRAILTEASEATEKTLIIEPYLPAKEILGEAGKPLGIETAKPLIGSTPAELEAAYPANFKRALDTLTFLEWTADEYGDSFKIEAGVDKGKVNRLQFWLHHGDNDEVKQALLATLEAKYGPAKKSKSALGREQLELSKKPHVVVGETKGAWVIEVTVK